jgi:hypothetical protein
LSGDKNRIEWAADRRRMAEGAFAKVVDRHFMKERCAEDLDPVRDLGLRVIEQLHPE